MAKINTREGILCAAMKLLNAKGFNGCSVQDIAAEAGVPKGSFYNHFESKEALAAEIVDRYARDAQSEKQDGRDALPPMQRLHAYFTSLNAKMSVRNFECGCLIGNFSAELADQSPLVRERLAAVYARWNTDIEIAIDEAQRAGSIGPELEPQVIAHYLLNAWEGAILRAKVERSSRALDIFMNVTFKKLLT